MKLWLVEIHEDDFEYDCFVSAVVWANDEQGALDLIYDAGRRASSDDEHIYLSRGGNPRLTAREISVPASAPCIVHIHWHAG